MIYFITALQNHFAESPEVYISGNNFLYWQEGVRKAVVSPDVYVVFGVEKRQRDLYKLWEEGQTPAVVFEFTSRKTRTEDIYDKLPVYEKVLRVPEYFLFDPTGDYLYPPLQGFRLRDGEYVAMEMAGSRLHSDQLGLDLVWEGETVRLFDPKTGDWLRTPAEEFQRAEEARQLAAEAEMRAREATQRANEAELRAQAEAQARQDAEAEAQRLRAELEALRAQRPE
jgi:Uma2 family endonuclease